MGHGVGITEQRSKLWFNSGKLPFRTLTDTVPPVTVFSGIKRGNVNLLATVLASTHFSHAIFTVTRV